MSIHAKCTERQYWLLYCMVLKLGLSKECRCRNSLHRYMMRYLRAIMNISWKDKITNIEAGLPSMEEMLIQMNLRWLGHVERMDHQRLPRQLLYSQLRQGKCNLGRPRLRFKDTAKKKPGEVGHRQEFLAAEGKGQSCVEESDQTYMKQPLLPMTGCYDEVSLLLIFGVILSILSLSIIMLRFIPHIKDFSVFRGFSMGFKNILSLSFCPLVLLKALTFSPKSCTPSSSIGVVRPSVLQLI